MKNWIVLTMLMMGQAAAASTDRIYMSPMEDSRWVLTVDSPVRCEIEHQIPRFGKAVFYQDSGRRLQLKVVTDHRYKKDMEIAFRSVTANWQGLRNETELAYLTSSGANELVNITSNAAREAYFELQQGFQPSLFFKDEEDGFNQVAVVLSTVYFRDVEAQFGECVANLYPLNFDDLRVTRVHFDFDEEFPKEEEEDVKLGRVLEYVKLDPSVKGLLIEGHADFKGTDCYNDSLSARRAWYVYDYLVQAGIDPRRLEIRFYGENSPLEPGKDDASRAANRRVKVTMIR